MRTIKKIVPATTNNLALGVKNFLLERGHTARIINNGAVYDPTLGIYRKKKKSEKGTADIIAGIHIIIRDYNSHERFFCQYVAFEIKNKETGDKMSEDQHEYKKEVETAGGLYVVIEKYQDVIDWYEQRKSVIYEKRNF